MASAVTREISIIYGSLTMGGATNYLPDLPKYTEDLDAQRGAVSWHVVVHGSSAANLKTACDAMEAEFKKRFQRLRITISGSTFLDWNPSSATNTGFNQEPSIEKDAGDVDSARARKYRCKVECDLPADDNTSRRESTVALKVEPGRRKIVTITGTYTAKAGTDARANYDNLAPTYCGAVLTSIGGAFELVDEDSDSDDQDKLITFVRRYEEVIYNQDASTLNNANIYQHDVRYARSALSAGYTPGPSVKMLERVVASYDCWVDSDSDTALHALWTGTIRPYVLAQAKSKFSAGMTAIETEEPELDPVKNRVRGTLTMMMAIQGADVLAYTVSQEIAPNPGKVIRRAHDGNPYSAYIYQGFAVARRTTQITQRSIGTRALGSVDVLGTFASTLQTQGAPKVGAIQYDTWMVVEGPTERHQPLRLGVGILGEQIDVTDSTVTIVEEFYARPSRGGGTVPATTTGVPWIGRGAVATEGDGPGVGGVPNDNGDGVAGVIPTAGADAPPHWNPGN